MKLNSAKLKRALTVILLSTTICSTLALYTDYVASGAEKYDGPAILIGETNYAESKEA